MKGRGAGGAEGACTYVSTKARQRPERQGVGGSEWSGRATGLKESKLNTAAGHSFPQKGSAAHQDSYGERTHGLMMPNWTAVTLRTGATESSVFAHIAMVAGGAERGARLLQGQRLSALEQPRAQAASRAWPLWAGGAPDKT